MYVCTYLYEQGLRGTYFIPGVIIKNSHYISGCSQCPSFVHLELLLVHVSFWHALVLYWVLPYFLTTQIFQAILILSLPQPWDQLLLQRAVDPFVGKWCLKIKDLDARYALWYLGVTELRLSQWTELGNICMYNNPCIYSHNLSLITGGHQTIPRHSTKWLTSILQKCQVQER